jgi:DEAD/DEAH box helicase domain-containing protein
LKPNPALNVAIRCANSESVRLINSSTNELLEELELARAIFDIYEGAVYLHEGQTFVVQHADFSDRYKKVAHLRPMRVDYITKQRDYTDVDAMGVRASMSIRKEATDGQQKHEAFFGEVRVTSTVYGYHKYDPRKHIYLETVEVYSPPYVRWSQGFWLDGMLMS